ncbi:MAG: FAD-dependent monooxygenase, partial [Ectothiorhodospiraceae bacterium]|nr:FAD-dependent monooxygenase [Ectothiorhodospiraceae bacterium]
FLGPAAHPVAPCGARGANGGIQGVENLCWKLGRVLRRQAPETLLDSYDDERQPAAAENILNSTRSTDFITPKSRISRVFRDAVLELAEHYPFARALVNSGRLSRPCNYPDSPLNTPDTDNFTPTLGPGTPAADAPVLHDGRADWLLHYLGDSFTLLLDGATSAQQAAELASELSPLLSSWADLRLVLLGPSPPALRALPGAREVEDCDALVRTRYQLTPGSAYLLRPDQHVAARWRRPGRQQVDDALHRALGFDQHRHRAQPPEVHHA